jgi:hypothetical protein
MSKSNKNLTINRNVYYDEQTYNEYYSNCIKLDVPMNRQTLLLIRDFNKKLRQKAKNGKI